MVDTKNFDKVNAIVEKGKGENFKYSNNDFLEIIRILRSPSGCPWDREQTHKTLTSNIIEESYEAVEAISNGDMSGLCEELGDVLLQIMLHSVIAEESGSFAFDDVVDVVARKMILRHPHVFADVKADTPEEVLKNWDAIKRAGKNSDNSDNVDGGLDKTAEVTLNNQQKLLRNVPKTLPALLRASKVQGRARNVGFDFESLSEVLEVLESEIAEVKEAILTGEQDKIDDELGDVLFSAVNLSRFVKADPEISLNASTDKFIARFSALERLANEENILISATSMHKLNEMWNVVKGQKNVEKSF